VFYLFQVLHSRRPVWLSAFIGEPTNAYAESLSVGVSLTATYGTGSIRRDDGSFERALRAWTEVESISKRCDGCLCHLHRTQRISVNDIEPQNRHATAVIDTGPSVQGPDTKEAEAS